MSHIYAYVTSEVCAAIRVFLPGTEYQGEPVSRHGDLFAWRFGKRETIALALRESDHVDYTSRCAWRVAAVMGWEIPERGDD